MRIREANGGLFYEYYDVTVPGHYQIKSGRL